MRKTQAIKITAFLFFAFLCTSPIPLYAFDVFSTDLQNGLTRNSAPGKNWNFSFSDKAGDTGAKVDDALTAFTASYEFGKSSSTLNFSYRETVSEKSFDLAAAPDTAFRRSTKTDLSFQAMEHFLLKNFTFTPVAGFTFSFMHEGQANESSETSSFKPMLGFNLARPIILKNRLRLTPEIHGAYHYEILDAFGETSKIENINANDAQLSHHGVRLGTALSFNFSNRLSGKLQFDSDLRPASREFLALFKLSYVW